MASARSVFRAELCPVRWETGSWDPGAGGGGGRPSLALDGIAALSCGSCTSRDTCTPAPTFCAVSSRHVWVPTPEVTRLS